MLKPLLFFIASVFLVQSGFAQEKLLYGTNFQNWSAIAASATETAVTKKTDFSNEDLTFKFLQVAVSPTGWDATRFDDPPASVGYAQAAKAPGSYIITTPLKSITKVVFIEGATGGNRGYKLWKKNATDADWVLVYNTVCTSTRGQIVTVNINESNVAIKFTNIDEAQNSYMFDLKIYGNYASANPQYNLTTVTNIPGAGTITRTPNSDAYDQGTVVSLQATANFGYKFIKWTDSLNADLSTTNPYSVTLNANQYVKAVFAAVNTYTVTVTIAGSKWGEVQLTPAPTNGKYEEGTVVTMKVVPNPVTNFSYWEDNSTTPERTVTINSDKTFTATFDEIPFIVGWNFKALTPTSNRTGDFYSETTNTGLISAYEPDGTVAGWLANASGFSPALPNIRLWTAGVDFKAKRRYLKANFSTLNYKNIQVKSLITANFQAYSVQTLQYSLDDVTYKELARVDITDVYNTAWKQLNATLPAEAEGKQKIYVKWIADDSSPTLGASTDNDGTAFTNIFVYADKNLPPDNDPPTLISVVPANGSNTASINGSVVLTFNETVKAGTGNITLNGTVLTPSFGSKTATFPYEKLSYNTQYTFNVPAGALTDASGNAFAGITVTFRTGVRLEPTKKLFDAVVAKDGTGDYTSVIDAIAGAPANRTQPWLIYIKNGKYTGHHDIPTNKPFLHLIGQTRDSVIISDNRLCGEDGDPATPVYSVNEGATMVLNSNDCYFEDITFENSFGYEKQTGPQALALYTEANHFTSNNCWLRSYQDTYLTTYRQITNRHYIKNTKIEGAVDFIYGAGDIFFDKCTITNSRNAGGYIVAPSHGAGTLWGYVFSNCTIDEAHTTGATNYFGRPWQGSPKTVFLNTTLKSGIYAKGWYFSFGAIPAVFADYGTMDAQGNLVDLSQRIEDYQYTRTNTDGSTTVVTGKAKKSLTDAEAATYTYENVILRSNDTWDPRMMTEAPEKPANVTLANKTISWNNVPYSRLYIVFRNNKVLGFTTNTSYTDTTTGLAAVTYAVQAVSEYGALSAITNTASGALPVTLLNFSAAAQTTGTVKVEWTTTNEINTKNFNVERSTDGSRFDAVATVKAGTSNSVTKQYTYIDAGIEALNVSTVYYRLKTVDADAGFSFSKVVKVPLKGNVVEVAFAPNPVLNALIVTIKQPNANAFMIRIVDAIGRQVYSESISAGQTAYAKTINVSKWQSGVYYLQMVTAGETKTTKLVKQ